MIDEHQVVLDGTAYVCTFYEGEHIDRSWGWSRRIDSITPPDIIRIKLDQVFISQLAKDIVEGLDESRRRWFASVLKAMGATDDDFKNCGLEVAHITNEYYRNPNAAERVLFALLPPPVACRSAFNCTTIRDWFFEGVKYRPLAGSKVACIGNSPFGPEFLKFLTEQDVIVAETHDHTEIVVLGRKGWSEEEIDQLIDSHVGGPLRIYSQEMLLGFLATNQDPFYATDLVKEAFRQGHPGLEFVSQGWPGWVNAWVTSNRRTTSANSEFATFNVEESPIHKMGYVVGRNGLPPHERQFLLENAFRHALPIVGGLAYMLEWGEPGTCERLHRIADHIATNCRNASNRWAWAQAVADWREDLEWLKESFYHGHCRFQWPDTWV